MNKKKVYIAGHEGMVGQALCKKLSQDETVELILQGYPGLDLTNQAETEAFIESSKPDEIYLAAARVGGILANKDYPAEFIYMNLMMECNVINAAYKAGVSKLLCLGSSCIYPKFAEQPIREASLLNGHLEPTNEPYAVAKIAGIKLCESYNRQYGTDYRSVMPTNLYGYNDNFHLEHSHVIPALVRRFNEAKESNWESVTIWGSGRARREFLFVDDLADACIYLMNLNKSQISSFTSPMQSHINIGTGKDVTIKELSYLIKEVVGFEGDIVFDSSKPDGTPRKMLDVTLLDKLGWSSSIDLKHGLEMTYKWFLENKLTARL